MIYCMPDTTNRMINWLNSLPKGTNRLMAQTVIRQHQGNWMLMNKKATGWASRCYAYKTIKELLADWNITVLGMGKDEYSTYFDVK